MGIPYMVVSLFVHLYVFVTSCAQYKHEAQFLVVHSWSQHPENPTRPFVKDDLPVLVGQRMRIEPSFEGIVDAANNNVAVVREIYGSCWPHGYHPTVNL